MMDHMLSPRSEIMDNPGPDGTPIDLGFWILDCSTVRTLNERAPCLWSSHHDVHSSFLSRCLLVVALFFLIKKNRSDKFRVDTPRIM